jgi:hypothetical protein
MPSALGAANTLPAAIKDVTSKAILAKDGVREVIVKAAPKN